MVSRCPEWCLELDVESQSLRRPHDVIRGAAAWSVVERSLWLACFKRDKMKCTGIKGHVLGKSCAIEVSSGNVRQKTTHIVVEAVDVNDSFWTATVQQAKSDPD